MPDRICCFHCSRLEKENIKLKEEIKVLRTVCDEAYQLAGCYEKVNVKALDNLFAAANGEVLPHESFLPVD